LDYRIIYSFPFFLSAALIFIVALITIKRVNVRAGWYLFGVCLSATVWAISEGALYLGLDIETNVIITKCQYIGIAFVPPLALLFGATVFDVELINDRKTSVTLFLIAAIIIILVWTNSRHQLIFPDYYIIGSGSFPMLGLTHGPLWWVIIMYHYALTVVLSAILIRQVFISSGYYRSQAGVILAAVGVVWLNNAIYVTGNSPVPNMDTSSIAFVIVAGAMAWGFYRYRLLDILPIAKGEIFQSLDDVIIVTDGENCVLDINPAAESLFKMKASNIIGQTGLSRFKEYPQFEQIINAVQPSEIHLDLDNEKRVYDLRISFIADRNKLKRCKVIALREITDRITAENARQQSEERYRSLVENTMDGYFICELPSAQFLFLNKRACDIFGYTLQEGLALSVWDIISKEDSAHVKERIQARFEGQEIDSERHAYTGIHKNGSSFRMEISTSLVTFKDNPAVQGVIRDITEQERLEYQLQQSKKMEAIGLLAGGVAHDLNNVLSGIVSYPNLILMDLPEDSPLKKPIQTIHSSGQKAAEIVQDLLTLARRGVSNKEILNLNESVQAYLQSPEYEKLKSYHPNVALKTNLSSHLLNIAGSPTQIIKMLMNLVSNAAEAQPTGGEITISTHNQYIDKPIQGYEEIEEGDFVVLEVMDDGLGIAANDLDRIFEPFYTKKVMGRSGTGLGMAVVWGTIHDHNGYIDIKTSEGVGTTFTLYFPVIREKETTKKDLIPIEEYLGNQEKLLVIDDILEQREIAATMLSKLNYSVIAVSSGEKAIEYLSENSVDLIVLDMIMDPGIDGLETYKRIIEIHPNQKAIIASGYAETDRVREAQGIGAGDYIRKPYILEKIGLAVKNELARPKI